MELTTRRLRIRPFTVDDAPFILRLVNDPDWLRYIGDRQVHSVSDAERYLREGPMAMQAREGFALGAVEQIADDQLIGMCGLVRREGLEHVDLGYAFMPEGRGQGYARESAQAVLDHALHTLGLSRVVAITDPLNAASGRVLQAIGMAMERQTTLPGGHVVDLWAVERQSSQGLQVPPSRSSAKRM